MASIGVELEMASLVLTKGRDFRWAFENLDENRQPTDFPAGDLYFEIAVGSPFTEWHFEIDGSVATIKVESTVVDQIPARAKWQLVFLPEGEIAGGDPEARGLVKVQGV